jgi:DNA-binding response OmpR family regulator
MPLLLIIEDDPELGPSLVYNFELEGYTLRLASDGRQGLNAALEGTADLILLDLMLPRVDGLHILRRLRDEGYDTPVIILTARGGEDTCLEGFRAGCDDYLAKPFSLKELLSRVRAVLRRGGYKYKPSAVHSHGLSIDPEARTATRNGEPVALAPREFELLYLLASHPGQALSRSFLLDEIWGEDFDVTTRTVDNHIASLRKKVEPENGAPPLIATVYKVGYRWSN